MLDNYNEAAAACTGRSELMEVCGTKAAAVETLQMFYRCQPYPGSRDKKSHIFSTWFRSLRQKFESLC